MSGYGDYIDRVSRDVTKTVSDMKCQPILFIGSGLSIRYFDGPSWEDLLEMAAIECPEFDQSVEYYLQGNATYPEIGSMLADAYYHWAWGDGKEEFPDELRAREYPQEIFLKHFISQHFDQITPSSIQDIEPERHRQEITQLQNIHPHSVITTNYDLFLDQIFPDYERIIGEEILRSPHESVGEIMHIHGNITNPESLILTEDDYKGFNEKKKYLSAKLLTYFAEHPVLIAGYSIEDENVKKILEDIDFILSPEDGLIDNIYFLQWEPNISDRESFPREIQVEVRKGDTVRVKNIVAKNFDWVFNCFGKGGEIEGINLKLLRTVMANTYDIIREKAPREEVRIDYESLERAANSEDTLGTMFGVTTLDTPIDWGIMYRYTLTDVAEELGYGYWHPANELIKQIEEETGVNIKESDNIYHIDAAPLRDYHDGRYSDATVELLRKVDQGVEYDLGELVDNTNAEASAEA